MTPGERLRKLRKEYLKITMAQFGERIGVGKTAISSIETGVNNLSDQMINSICKTNWNGKYVNETWLRTGEGEMFVPDDDDELSRLQAKFGLSPVETMLIKKFVTLDKETRAAVLAFTEAVSKGYSEMEAEQKEEVKEKKTRVEEEEEAYIKELSSAGSITSTALSSTSEEGKSETA